jgi:hypothetical protein
MRAAGMGGCELQKSKNAQRSTFENMPKPNSAEFKNDIHK